MHLRSLVVFAPFVGYTVNAQFERNPLNPCKAHGASGERCIVKDVQDRVFVVSDDPYTPLPYCPTEIQNPGGKIPLDVLLEAHEAFRSNGGAVVINNDYRDGTPEDFVEATVKATDFYIKEIAGLLTDGLEPTIETFDTPVYEGPLGEPGDSGFTGCANCTLPEPYPFRTALPKINLPRCPNLPYAIFVPATIEDAAHAISTIKDHGETFTILSGGHDYECQSGVYYGVIIITSLLNRLDIDFETGIAHMGAGVLWQTVYDRIHGAEVSGKNAMRYGAMGAQCGLVSVSGYTLGGGLSWMHTPLHGIGSDHAIAIKAITANGEIVDARLDDPQTIGLRYGMAGTGGMSMAMAAEFTFQLQKSRPKNYYYRILEWRFADSFTSGDGEYTLDAIRPIMIGLADALDVLADDPEYKDKIGGSLIHLQHRHNYGSNGGHRIQARLYAAEDTDLAEFSMIQDLISVFPPRRSSLHIYTSINDSLKRGSNSYPGEGPPHQMSEFIKKGGIQNALDIHLRYYLETGDDFPNGPNRELAGSNIRFVLLDRFVKHPGRVSWSPANLESRWHFASRAWYEGIDEKKSMMIECKQREITRQLKLKLGNTWAGPYWNYLDGSVDKTDYYDPNGGSAHFEKVSAIKKKWDPDNFFKKIKGINVNDNSVACLEEFCAALPPQYYDGWTF